MYHIILKLVIYLFYLIVLYFFENLVLIGLQQPVWVRNSQYRSATVSMGQQWSDIARNIEKRPKSENVINMFFSLFYKFLDTENSNKNCLIYVEKYL